jgi:hypothetical protein
MLSKVVFFVVLAAGSTVATLIPSFPPHLVGNVSSVYALIERVIPGASAHFSLSLSPNCAGILSGANCFTLADDGSKIAITGTTASEITGGLGVYLREYCGMTVGWVRGGGTNVFLPSSWPKIGGAKGAVSQARSVPYSHVTQVCTHSYTLVWHDWAEWEQFIDWMALAGHNSIVAPTGQEEVQYKVLTEQFGVSDIEVRNWTMGPAWLTWSRGQNSHGNGVGGPLPRSFMKNQWSLQKQILGRYRSLGIVGHLPAFGGYAPWAVAVAQNATNRIARGKSAATDTAWIDGRDPLYTAIADAWVKSVIADFGSDHVWQMDSFFANGSSWGATSDAGQNGSSASSEVDAVLPPCVWSSAFNNTYLAGYATPSCGSKATSVSFPTLAEAKAACVSTTYTDCGGVVSRKSGAAFELRAGPKPIHTSASDREASYVVTNRAQCVPGLPRCAWSAAIHNTYLSGYVVPSGGGSTGPVSLPTLAEAKTACLNASYRENCGGIVARNKGTAFELRAGTKPIHVPASDGEASYIVTNKATCAPLCPAPDAVDIWHNRSTAAYSAVVRADGPTARWIYQGTVL